MTLLTYDLKRELNVRGKASANEDMDSGYESPGPREIRRAATRVHANRHGVKRRNPSLERGMPPPGFLGSLPSAYVQAGMGVELLEGTSAVSSSTP